MEISLTNVLNGGLLAAVIALVGLVLNQRSQLVRIETILTGATGENGLVGDMQAQRKRTHALADDLNVVKGRVDIVAIRLDEWDRRQGPDDRRGVA